MRYRQAKKILKGTYKNYSKAGIKIFRKTGEWPNGESRYKNRKRHIKKRQYEKFYKIKIGPVMWTAQLNSQNLIWKR